NAGASVRCPAAADTRLAKLVSSALVGMPAVVRLAWFCAMEAASSCASSWVRLLGDPCAALPWPVPLSSAIGASLRPFPEDSSLTITHPSILHTLASPNEAMGNAFHPFTIRYLGGEAPTSAACCLHAPIAKGGRPLSRASGAHR